MKKLALVIDDESDIRQLISITLKKMGVDVITAENVVESIAALQNHSFDICLSDMKLPDGDGFEILRFIQENQPKLPTAIITAHGNMDLAVQALKLGAFDFISKPLELAKFRSITKAALKLDEINQPAKDLLGLTGNSASIEAMRQQINKVARNQAPVFINGESGSGKELVARAIHYSGPRSNGPFVPVNCGAIPDDLMESEFFGHPKGSFTGAQHNKQGLFQAADGGTLFLDEVADLPLHMQVKLLRAIQERAVRPVGSNSEVAVDIRILSATHKDLLKEVQTKTFREDLYYRVNVIQLNVPALRERPEDIKPLAEQILSKLASQSNCPVPTLDKDALKSLQQHSFPGNVRELENILERAFTLSDGNTINKADINLHGIEIISQGKSTESQLPSLEGYESIDHYLEEIEKDLLINALEQTKWNKTASAKKLGISFRQIRHRLKKFGLDDD